MPASNREIKKDTHGIILFYNKVMNDWVLNFSAMLSYNMLVSFIPIITFILGIFGIFLGSTSLESNIIQSLQKIFPAQYAESVNIQQIVSTVHKNSLFLTFISLILAAYFGSGLFISMEGALDIIYKSKMRSFPRQQLVALGMLVLFLILIPLMIFLAGLPTFLASNLGNHLLKSRGVSLNLHYAGIIGGVLAAFILFLAIYTVVPNKKIKLRETIVGSLLAAILVEVYILFFPYYITHFLNASAYGQVLGFALVIVAFFYYFSLILLLGAELNSWISGDRSLQKSLPDLISDSSG